MTNAIKYRKLNVPPIINIRSFYSENYKILSVADNGMGINMERHGEAIFMLHKRFHRDRPGRGLGLFMTKTQIESMGGKITVESQEGKGTEFKVYFI